MQRFYGINNNGLWSIVDLKPRSGSYLVVEAPDAIKAKEKLLQIVGEYDMRIYF